MTKTSPFVRKLRKIIKEPAAKNLIVWNEKNYTLTILKPEDFSIKILPFYFKHCNFSSFVRQLNLYGFHKIDPQAWVFRHEDLTSSLFSEFYEIKKKKKNLEIRNNFSKIEIVENQIKELRISEQRMFIFLSKILDLFVDHHNSVKMLVKIIKILSMEIYSLSFKISQLCSNKKNLIG